MTACATVADLLAITDNPAAMSQRRVMAALGVCRDRARVVHQLAIEAARMRHYNPHGLSEQEMRFACEQGYAQ